MISLFKRPSPESDINTFMWSFDQSQISIESAKSVMSKSSIDLMTSKGSSKFVHVPNQHLITPAIQKLCRGLDESLGRLLSDIDSITNNVSPSHQSIVAEDFKRFYEYLQVHLNEFSNNMCASLSSLIADFKAQVASAVSTDSANLEIKRILLICRFSHALTVYCPNLKSCYSNINFILQQKLSVSNRVSGISIEPNFLLKKKFAEQKVIPMNF